MNILFYDLDLVLIHRYPRKIAESLNRRHDDLKFVFLFSEKTTISIKTNLPENSHSIYAPNLRGDNLRRIYSEYKINVVVTCAQRLSDMLVTSTANKLLLYTITVQHGIWSDTITRLPWYAVLFSKFSKFVFYIHTALELSKVLETSTIALILDSYKFFYVDKSVLNDYRHLNHGDVRAKMVLAFDKTWTEYYTNKFDYKENQIRFIGNPDFLMLSDSEKCEENSVGYICQSLVEDGRLNRVSFRKFLSQLASSLPEDVNLYLKLHPRSDRSLYDHIIYRSNVFMVKNLPICNRYIGHYSSLLVVTKALGRKNLLWEIEGHYIPKNFLQYGNQVTNDWQELRDFLSRTHELDIVINDNMNTNPYTEAADIILNLYPENKG